MKTLCRLTLLVSLALLSCSVFAQEQDVPKDPKVYSFANLPFDSQPHWEDDDGVKKYSVGYKLFTAGKGFGRTAEDAGKQDAVKFSDQVPSTPDSAGLGLVATVTVVQEGAKKRQLLVYLAVTPDEGETRIGSVILDMDTSQKLLDQLDDLLRIGRKWRDEGIAKADKKVALSTLNSQATASALNLAIDKFASSSDQTWSVWSNRVYFKNSDLVSLSKFRDKVEMAINWLERKR